MTTITAESIPNLDIIRWIMDQKNHMFDDDPTSKHYQAALADDIRGRGNQHANQQLNQSTTQMKEHKYDDN